MVRIKLYAKLALFFGLALLLGIQTFRLWLRGAEASPVQSVYRHQRTRIAAKPLDPPKGSQPSNQFVQGFKTLPNPSDHNPTFTIGRWELEKIPCNRDVIVTVTADPEGKPSLDYEVKSSGISELGYDRQLALYATQSFQLSDELKKSLEIGIEYQHDLFRLGPAWTSFRLNAGYEQTTMADGQMIRGAKVGGTIRVGIKL